VKTPLKVATYNIHKCIGNDRKRDPKRILSVLNEIDADVIALQEADRRFGSKESCIPAAMLATETTWQHVPVGIRPNSIGWHGNALLVRKGIEIRDAKPLHLPMLEPRGAVMAEIVIGGYHLRIIGVHLDLSGLWRRKQVRWLLNYLETAVHHLPTIMMGDFNQWSNRGALSEFAFHRYRLIKTAKSFHSARPIANLDRIIVSHDIEVLENGVHISPLSKLASDHLPIWAELKVGHTNMAVNSDDAITNGEAVNRLF
jgi:endonuclease/exonuclease/phosphatase family metal-dependent hydrolase